MILFAISYERAQNNSKIYSFANRRLRERTMFISFHALSKVSKEVSTAEQVEVDPTLRIISYNHDSGYERPTLVNALNTREVAQARCLQSFEWRGRPKVFYRSYGISYVPTQSFYDYIVFVKFCLFSSLSWTFFYFNWRKKTLLMLGLLYRFARSLLVTIVVKTIYKLTRKFITRVFPRIVKKSE